MPTLDRTRFALVLAASALVAASLLAGCGGGSSNDTDDGDATTAEDATTDEDATTGEDTPGPLDIRDCAGLQAIELDVMGIDGAIASNNTSIELQLVFSEAVGGVQDGLAIDGGASVASVISDDDITWTVTIADLAPGSTYTLTVAAADVVPIATPGTCDLGALVADTAVTFDVGLWDTDDIQVDGALPPIAGPLFVEVTEAALLADATDQKGRAQVIDLDGDGADEIVAWPVTQAPFEPRALKPQMGADGVFYVDITEQMGLDEVQATLLVFGDIDNDGDQDLFTGIGPFYPEGDLGIWLNNDGVFEFQGANGIADPVLGTQGTESFYKDMTAASFADFDGDGFLDLYVGTWYGGSDEGGRLLPPDDELYKGNGDGTFTQVTLPSQHNPLSSQSDPGLAGASRAAYGIAVSDYDNDGDLDIFVNNYGAGRPALDSPPLYIDHNLLWRNDGDMTFTDVGVEMGVSATMRGIGGVQQETSVVLGGTTYPSPIGGNGFGCQWGDLDNDGDMDLAIGTIAHPDYPQSDRTMLHYNPGNGDAFTEESEARGLQYYEDELHPALIDWDNDGRLDFAMSRLRGGSKWELYHQGADGNFTKLAKPVSGVDIERPGPTVWTDFDDDGDLDFFMPRDGGGRLFRNDFGAQNHWLQVDLVGTAPTDATGARVILETSVGTQVREITNGNGHFNTQFTDRLHFGLGKDTGASNVRVVWPDGTTTELGDVRADVHLRVTQETGEVELVRDGRTTE